MQSPSTIPYKTLFGPVPSRRLGISLGVDLVPHKTCSLDCVYCECGRTTHLTVDRDDYVSVDQVMDELKAYLSQDRVVDHITFSGSGEPTLNSGIGEIVRFLKSDYPRNKIALLTNSTLFGHPEVRHQVRAVDVVMASLDAATAQQFDQINRPHPQLDLNDIVEGLASFRRIYPGRLLIEIFVVRGINDEVAAIAPMKPFIERIHADGILLNTLDRPAADDWVEPVDAKQLKEISDFFEDADIVKYEPAACMAGERQDEMMARLVATVRRRPYTVQDMSQIMGLDVATLQPMLDRLVASDQLMVKPMARGLFYLAV